MHETFTPKEVAQAIGASESTVKRWCDRGLLGSEKTPGRHRRISLGDLVQMARQRQLRLQNATVLGLPPGTGAYPASVDAARDTMTRALIDGDESTCRRAVLDCYLAGARIVEICDRLIAPAFHQIGRLWEGSEVEIYQERRASEITRRLLGEMRGFLPAPSADAPVAMGATPLGDHFALPTAMVELILRDGGWNANSLGVSLPLEAMVTAIRHHRPQLFWISVSFLADCDSFLAGYHDFYETIRNDAAVVVGGRALTGAIRRRMQYAAFCDSLQHLESFATASRSRGLPTAGAARQQVPEKQGMPAVGRLARSGDRSRTRGFSREMTHARSTAGTAIAE